MSPANNGLKKAMLFISVILCGVFLVSGVFLFVQMGRVLGSGNPELEISSWTPEEQQRVAELPELEGYKLRQNATGYQIELFELLVHTHQRFQETGSEHDLEAYAIAIVRNFIADFFTLSNKRSRSDVGGLQFFSEDLVDNFRRFAIDEFYLYLNQHIEMFGSDVLPTVADTTILDVMFEYRIVDIEEVATGMEEMADIYQFHHGDEAVTGQQMSTIVIDAQWTYDPTTLPYIDEFQKTGRFVLVFHDEIVSIYLVGLIPTEAYIDPW
ncbi:MAG: hypothetical protein FWG67_04930 [Defluviitaleaceae bacterium]|nr:hypothetical protein [Defluviitaleaceae bacterium]